MNDSNPGFFSRLYYSITSFDKYRCFLGQSTGKAVVYLLLLSLFLGAAISIQFGIEFNRIIDGVITDISDKIPDFELANGKLDVKGQMPIIIGNSDYPLIIDTSPNADERILDQYDTAVLLTRDKMIQKNYTRRSVTDLGQLQGIVMNRQSIENALPMMKPIGNIVIVFIGIFFVCGKFISALIVYLVGMMVNSAKNTRLTYGNIFKISVYSMTLPLILGTALDIAVPMLPYKWLLFYAIAFTYVIFAMNSIKKWFDSSDFNSVNDSGIK